MARPSRKPTASAGLWQKFGWPILLLLGIVSSALGVTYQVYLHREAFNVLQQERRERERLDVEWSRLLIEQQTFGATTQIGGRAVMRLQMYSPPPSQTVTVNVPADLASAQPVRN